MNKIIDEHIDQIRAICVDHNVKSLFAFGSVVTDRFSDSSDIDLLISFNSMDYGDYAYNYFNLDDKF